MDKLNPKKKKKRVERGREGGGWVRPWGGGWLARNWCKMGEEDERAQGYARSTLPRKKKIERGGARLWEWSWVRSWGGRLSEAVRGWLTGKESVRDGWGGWEGSGLCEIDENETKNNERVRELGLIACVSERAERWRATCEWESCVERWRRRGDVWD